jgi:hypothetical protein
MKYLSLSLALSLLSGICLAQRPTPPLQGGWLAPSDISVNFLLPVKDCEMSHYGVGGLITTSRYFSDHFGAQLQGDYMRTNYINYHEAGVKVGPVIRFWTKSAIEPYVHVLVGYSRVKDSNLKPTTSYHGSGSILGGGGLDFPLAGAWYGRVGADIQQDWTVRQRAGRGIVGVSYKFGAGETSRPPRM